MFRVQRSRKEAASRPAPIRATLEKSTRFKAGGQLLDGYSVYRVVKQSSLQITRAALVCSVIAGLLALPSVSSTPDRKVSDDAQRVARLFNKKLHRDQQILHAFDRLSFG